VTGPDPDVIHEILKLIMKGDNKSVSEGSKMIFYRKKSIKINVNETKKS
jgi:hypothetical protein